MWHITQEVGGSFSCVVLFYFSIKKMTSESFEWRVLVLKNNQWNFVTDLIHVGLWLCNSNYVSNPTLSARLELSAVAVGGISAIIQNRIINSPLSEDFCQRETNIVISIILTVEMLKLFMYFDQQQPTMNHAVKELGENELYSRLLGKLRGRTIFHKSHRTAR